jgi:hypothetical protein
MPATAALKKTVPQLEDERPRETSAQPKTLRAAPRLFHARMVVTRIEEWCVEAETAEEARALLASGAGHRCTPGESVQMEFESLLDE